MDVILLNFVPIQNLWKEMMELVWDFYRNILENGYIKLKKSLFI